FERILVVSALECSLAYLERGRAAKKELLWKLLCHHRIIVELKAKEDVARVLIWMDI
ncbi:Os02g0216600, partial [Oryza sativa Japonica Group]